MKTKDIKTETTTARGQMIKTDQAHMLNYELQNGSSVSVNISDSVHNNTVTNDDIVGTDFQGWPTYQIRLISLLRVAEVDESVISQIPQSILTKHLWVAQDDGMGYVVNDKKITDITKKGEDLCLIY